MGLVENIMSGAYSYWTPAAINQFAEEVSSYRYLVLEHREHAPIIQLSSLEERARKLQNKYWNGMYRGAILAIAGLGIIRLDWMYNLKPEIIEQLATPVGYLIAIAGVVHTFRGQQLKEDVEYLIASAEKTTNTLGAKETPVS